MDIKDAMQQATITLRDNLGQGNSVLAPNSSEPIIIDPVMDSYFGLEVPDAEVEAQVNTIKDYLRGQGATSPAKQLALMRKLETKLGDRQPGTRVERLHRYVRLKMQAQTLTLQARAMKR